MVRSWVPMPSIDIPQRRWRGDFGGDPSDVLAVLYCVRHDRKWWRSKLDNNAKRGRNNLFRILLRCSGCWVALDTVFVWSNYCIRPCSDACECRVGGCRCDSTRLRSLRNRKWRIRHFGDKR